LEEDRSRPQEQQKKPVDHARKAGINENETLDQNSSGEKDVGA
jgi:hypothetical protein